MSDLKVCAIMLTCDRPQYVQQAFACFRSQTYPNKCLLVLDTGDEAADLDTDELSETTLSIARLGLSVGVLRNEANEYAAQVYRPDILMHFDDDDWSHPNRMAEQVALLESSGADCVGYRECLFWREAEREAWLYSVPLPWPTGASMCYWTRVWKGKPFPDLPTPTNPEGEDVKWRRNLKCVAVPAAVDSEPRMVCRIHGGNTTNYSDLLVVKYRDTWKRVPDWDTFCRETLG